MEAQIEQYADEYEIISELGSGGQATVYLGRLNQVRLALKVYHSGASKQAAYRKQKDIFALIEHENHIRMIDHRPAARFKLQNKPEERRPLIVLELAQSGDLFDYLSKTGRFSPQLARAYFRQLISAVKYLDNRGITHRDLKPDNILLDRNYTLKVSDFGLARDTRGDFGNYELTSRVGTDGYRAPEVENIVHGHTYEGLKADLFAMGVILFIMHTGTPPFLSTGPQDRIYARIRANNYAQFWQLHERSKPPGFYSDSFKRLINCFLCADPQRRPTFEILAGDEWIGGPVPTFEELINEMNSRAVRIGLPLQQRTPFLTPANIHTMCNYQGTRGEINLQDESVTKQEVFAYYYNSLRLKNENLPQYELNNVRYVNKQAKLIVSWIHYYLFQQRAVNNVFLREFVEEIKFLRYEVKFNEENAFLQVRLNFQVGQQDEKELVLRGELHRSLKEQVGIKWAKAQGNSYWLSEVQAQITQSLAYLQ